MAPAAGCTSAANIGTVVLVTVRQRIYPEAHWRIAEVQALLGASLADQGKIEEARELMRAADRGLAAVPGRVRERDANLARLHAMR